VTDSTIRVRNPVKGAIHVTGCHTTALWSRSQQLRLHESTDLQCHSIVSAGAILEDCTRLFFWTLPSSLLEVKDFNWLKQGIASPNYSIVEEEEKVNVSPVENPTNVHSTTAKLRDEELASNSRVIDEKDRGEEDDEDDEL
jgi:hypothetical protein